MLRVRETAGQNGEAPPVDEGVVHGQSRGGDDEQAFVIRCRMGRLDDHLLELDGRRCRLDAEGRTEPGPARRDGGAGASPQGR